MLSFFPAVLGAIVTIILAVASVYAKALTPTAGAVAAIFGIVVVVLGGFPFLALLVLFVVGSVLATRFRFEEKIERKVQEGHHGERGVSNVLAHILLPTGLVIISAAVPTRFSPTPLALLYTSALAFGASDTFASEFGVLAGTARSLLTGRPVTPGTNGGVSALGELWAFAGAIITAAAGLGLFLVFSAPVPWPPVFVLIATIAGFLGCQVDSLLGETLENRGRLTKGSTNFLGMLFAVVLSLGLLSLANL